MRTRIFYTDFHEDEFIEEVDIYTAYLYMYLFTNHKIGFTGIYKCSDFDMMLRAKIRSKPELEKRKIILEERHKVYFFNGWVFAKNAERLGGYKGEKNLKAKQNEIAQIPKEVFDYFKKVDNQIEKTDRVSEKEDRVSVKSDTPINHKSKIINHKLEPVKTSNYIVLTPAQKIIQKYNEISGKKLTSTVDIEDNLKYWEEIHTLDDILLALELGYKKHSYWKEKITPTILLRRKNPNGEKVDRIGEMLLLKPKEIVYKPAPVIAAKERKLSPEAIKKGQEFMARIKEKNLIKSI